MSEHLLLAVALVSVPSFCGLLAFIVVWVSALSIYERTKQVDDISKIIEAAGKFPWSSFWSAVSSAVGAARDGKRNGDVSGSGRALEAVGGHPADKVVEEPSREPPGD
jgi:hypothetical protein